MIDYENLNLVNKPFEQQFKVAFEQFLDRGHYILGEEVRLFEEEFATYCGSKYCVGLASGLDALYLSLIALELPKGSEVLVPSNTYIATITSIINAGLIPVLVEPKIDTYNINPILIEEQITSKSKVIMVVHLYGKMCEMESILQIAKKNNLHIIEDCAQAHGAAIDGRKAGTFGTFGAYSFYPTKNLGALGDAGAIITDNEEYAIKLKALRNYGSHQKYYNQYIGINSRLDELQASFLRIKLKSLDQLNAYKTALAHLYFEQIKNPLLILPLKQASYIDSHHIFNIRCIYRDELKAFLLKNGIKSEIHYPIPPHQQVGYQSFFSKDYPISELIHQTTLSLPISNLMQQKDIEYVCTVLNNFEK
ncbi:DegT/DnrJ/EryC1/StrS family aminotransferase [Pedobacter sp.]|uniref:DegT/DnrJ/EryC1/StrS family aminotransferase n=1 Tax=Pedobacter sp. TaxID=1411316 RepID=UPI0031E2861F